MAGSDGLYYRLISSILDTASIDYFMIYVDTHEFNEYSAIMPT